jgi:hypothetical protein
LQKKKDNKFRKEKQNYNDQSAESSRRQVESAYITQRFPEEVGHPQSNSFSESITGQYRSLSDLSSHSDRPVVGSSVSNRSSLALSSESSRPSSEAFSSGQSSSGSGRPSSDGLPFELDEDLHRSQQQIHIHRRPIHSTLRCQPVVPRRFVTPPYGSQGSNSSGNQASESSHGSGIDNLSL